MRPSWSTLVVLDQLRLHSATLSQKEDVLSSKGDDDFDSREVMRFHLLVL